LNNFLRTHRTKLYGILNGIDNDVWNPRVDKHIFKNYDARTLKLKSQNKLSLQKELGLEVNPNIALLGMVCRLSEQKGLDILVPVISKITKNTQLVLLGKGDKYYEDKLISIKSKKLKNLSISIVFDETLAHKIYAAADIFLMPSRYEPCGLGQMISFRYGTIPVARRTGGLADTIIDVDSDSIHGTGFLFENYSSKDFFHTIKRALNYFKNKRFWYKLQKRVMQLDYSWNRSAYKYCELYKNLIKS
jgi:starch synthase